MTSTLDPGFILSDPPRRIVAMHHPWRRLREHLPDWTVQFSMLAPGRLGETDLQTRTISLRPDLLQCQRRTVLDHELIHAEDGDDGCQHPAREAAIDQAVARRLIPLDRLLAVVVWAHDVEELADECWVDTATMQIRLDHLDQFERDALRRAIAIRDYHEEGMCDGPDQTAGGG
jgi:hypothetical protein